MQRNLRVVVAAAAAVGMFGAASAARAQETPRHNQVISANPFGLLLEWFNAEYERGVSESATVGIGGSFADFEDDVSGADEQYFNGDVFFRFYPSGEVFDGWNFGVKAGITTLPSGTYPGFGFDANRSWLLGKNDNFYVGLGFGLKRLIGEVAPGEIEVIPTIRLVNVGFAF